MKTALGALFILLQFAASCMSQEPLATAPPGLPMSAPPYLEPSEPRLPNRMAAYRDPVGDENDDSNDVPPAIDKGKQALEAIQFLSDELADLAGAIQKAIEIYNSPAKLVSLFTSAPAGHTIEDVYQGVQELLVAASGASWQLTEIMDTHDMAPIQVAQDDAAYCAQTNQSPCPLTGMGSLDWHDAIVALTALEGNPWMDFDKLPTSALRNSVDKATDGIRVPIPALSGSNTEVTWKDVVKTRASFPNGWDNLVFDWRLAVPVLMNAISKNLLLMASANPNYQCDAFYTPYIQRHIKVLQVLRDEMVRGFHCNWKPFAHGTDLLIVTMCADVNTGLASQLVQSGTMGITTPYICPELGLVDSLPDDYPIANCSVGSVHAGAPSPPSAVWTAAHADPAQMAAHIKLLRSQVIAGMPIKAVEEMIVALQDILRTSCLPPAVDASAWTQGTIGTTGQAYPRDFNAFVETSVGGLRDVQGSLAAGGSLSLTSMNINPRRQSIGIVAGGDLTLRWGTVRGIAYYGQRVTVDGVTLDANALQAGMPIAFAPAFDRLRMLSAALGRLATSAVPGATYMGSKSRPNWGRLLLSSVNPVLSVFDLSAVDFVDTYEIEFVVPATSTVVINVSGTPVRIQNAGIGIGGLSPSRILWNFFHATSVTVQSVGMRGSILAPSAALKLNWGNSFGTVVGKTVAGDSELYEAAFRGNWLVP